MKMIELITSIMAAHIQNDLMAKAVGVMCCSYKKLYESNNLALAKKMKNNIIKNNIIKTCSNIPSTIDVLDEVIELYCIHAQIMNLVDCEDVVSRFTELINMSKFDFVALSFACQ